MDSTPAPDRADDDGSPVRIGAIVQARMSSERLPGKVLLRVADQPLLSYLIDRLRRVGGLESVLVATSTDSSDDPVAAWCAGDGTPCHRGDLSNVALRFKQALEPLSWEAFVRVSGDSPLLDPALVEEAIGLAGNGEYDLVTNVFPRSFPPGQSVELVRRDAFEAAFPEMREPDEIEHVTAYFYKNPTRFRIRNFSCQRDCSGVRMSVDTPSDLAAFTAVVETMRRPHWEYHLTDLLLLYRNLVVAS